ncbi:GlxA family transcriptional regulator [Desulfocicer niacini]
MNVDKKKHIQKTKRLSVGFILVPNFTLIAFSGFVAVLRHAADEGDNSRQVLCSWTLMAETLSPITSSCGVQIVPWERFKNPGEFDYVVVVGGLLPKQGMYEQAVVNYLQSAEKHGCHIVGLCTGSFYLAKAGLMKNRKCCVHWFHFQDFIDQFPLSIPVTDEIFIEDRGYITCPGGTSVNDLALFIIERHLGKERAIKCLRHLLLDWGRTHNHPQMPFTENYLLISDPRVRKAIFFMEQNLDKFLTVAEIADHVSTSARQIERLFKIHLNKSPLAYFRKIRLSYGKWIIQNTERSITEIAYECGFSDGSHFSRCFKAEFGKTPAEVRKIKSSESRQA